MTTPFFISKEDIINALDNSDWYVKKAADLLKTSRDILTRRMKEYNILPKRRRGEKYGNELIKNKNHVKFKKAYSIYSGIKKRCFSDTEPCYHRYGGRGITMSNDWVNSFNKFFDDNIVLENAFNDGFDIDRINNDGDYCLGNIRFVSHKKNCNNTSSNRRLSVDNRTMTISEWSDYSGINQKTITDRIDKLGWSEKDAVSIIPNCNKKRTKNRKYRITNGEDVFIVNNLKKFCNDNELSYSSFIKILSKKRVSPNWKVDILIY